MMYRVGDKVRRQVDNVDQHIYDIDSINRLIHVNWLSSKGVMMRETHYVPSVGPSPVILIPDPLRKRK